MSLDQVRYFVAVAEEGTIRGAAARLHISQPPLTRSLQALEAEFGVRLFDRSHSGVQLRPEGALFLEHAREALRWLEAGAAAVSATPGVRSGVGRGPARAPVDPPQR